MQAYRIEELVIRDPKNPVLEKVLSEINLERVVKWGPFVLLGTECTVICIDGYRVLFPPTVPHLTWVFIAETFESFSAKMLSISTVKVGPQPTEPIMPPIGVQSATYEAGKGTDRIPYYEMPTEEDGVVMPPFIDLSAFPVNWPKKPGRQKKTPAKKAAKKR